MLYRPLGFAIRGIAIGDRRRITAAPGPVITRVSPELAGLRSAASGVEHRRGGLVGKQLAAPLEVGEQVIAQRRQPPRRASDPVRQRRTIDMHALAGVDLRLPI